MQRCAPLEEVAADATHPRVVPPQHLERGKCAEATGEPQQAAVAVQAQLGQRRTPAHVRQPRAVALIPVPVPASRVADPRVGCGPGAGEFVPRQVQAPQAGQRAQRRRQDLMVYGLGFRV